jgi:hypothetical protein
MLLIQRRARPKHGGYPQKALKKPSGAVIAVENRCLESMMYGSQASKAPENAQGDLERQQP